MKKIFTLFLFLFSIICFAAEISPIGVWRTFDLDHKERGLVKLSIKNGSLVGIIVNNHSANKACTACKGPLHGQPIIGMTIIWGLAKKGNAWENGYVLDIDSGKTYRCKISISEDNQTLHFSPYVGIPLFGPTLDWKRA